MTLLYQHSFHKRNGSSHRRSCSYVFLREAACFRWLWVMGCQGNRYSMRSVSSLPVIIITTTVPQLKQLHGVVHITRGLRFLALAIINYIVYDELHKSTFKNTEFLLEEKHKNVSSYVLKGANFHPALYQDNVGCICKWKLLNFPSGLWLAQIVLLDHYKAALTKREQRFCHCV